MTGQSIIFVKADDKRSIAPQATFTVTNTNDSGAGSLRQAIMDANNNPGLDMIGFNVGTEVQTIRPQAPLPTITDQVIIDGTTQSGFTGRPIIELDGSDAGGGTYGLVINAENSTVKGLAIGNFGAGAIRLVQLGNNTIMGNFLGTDASGQQNRGNGGEGVNILNSNDNLITGNTIVFNSDGGSVINSSGNVIRGNNLGTDSGMTRDMGNSGAGFGYLNASNNRFEGNRVFFNRLGFIGSGGTGNTFGGTDPRNANIIGRNETGIMLNNSSNNLLQGNFIGTNPLSDNLGNQITGIELAGTSSNNTIGGSTVKASNWIAFNRTGITASSGTSGNIWIFNLLFNNTEQTIRLDSGANRAVPPVNLISAEPSSTETIIRGSYSFLPNRQFGLQFYSSPRSNPTEGKTPLGAITLTTNSFGEAGINARVPVPLTGGQNITALVTLLPTNDTSSFSNGVPVTGTAKPDLEAKKSAPDTAICGENITYTITVTNVGTAAAVGATVIDTLPACVGDMITVTTSPEGLTTYPEFGNRVATLVARLDPGASVTITITALLAEDCAGNIVNFASTVADGDTNTANNQDDVLTKVDCVQISGFSVQGKHVIVSGTGFERGDTVEINGVLTNTKFKGEDELKAKKGKKSLLGCDSANPDRMNVIKLIRSRAPGAPILDTAAFATCP